MASGPRVALSPVPCAYCGEPKMLSKAAIKAKAGGKVYCSKACHDKSRSAAGQATKPCSHCGKGVTRKKSAFTAATAFCGPECLASWRRAKSMVTFSCARCGGEKTLESHVYRQRTRDGRPAYCSRRCGTAGGRAKTKAAQKAAALKRTNAKGELQCVECERWLPKSKFWAARTYLGVYNRCGKCMYIRARARANKGDITPKDMEGIQYHILPGFGVLDLDRPPVLRPLTAQDRSRDLRWVHEDVWACPVCDMVYDTAGEAKFCCQWWLCKTKGDEGWLRKALASAQ